MKVIRSTLKKILVTGSSIVRHVNLGQRSVSVKYIPGSRAGDIKEHLKFMAKDKQRVRQIGIQCGCNDANLKMSQK